MSDLDHTGCIILLGPGPDRPSPNVTAAIDAEIASLTLQEHEHRSIARRLQVRGLETAARYVAESALDLHQAVAP